MAGPGSVHAGCDRPNLMENLRE